MSANKWMCIECGGDYESRLSGIHVNVGNPLRELAVQSFALSLDYRCSGTDWPAPWRARSCTNKNERYNYRLTAYGEAPEDALQKLRVLIGRENEKARSYFTKDPTP